MTRASASSCSCSSVKLWNGIVAAGYGSGQIRLYEAASGALRAEVNAHARWIYALDLAPETGKVHLDPGIPPPSWWPGVWQRAAALCQHTVLLPPGDRSGLSVPTASVPLPWQLLSGAEDSFVHVWKLSRDPDTDDIEVSDSSDSPWWGTCSKAVARGGVVGLLQALWPRCSVQTQPGTVSPPAASRV